MFLDRQIGHQRLKISIFCPSSRICPDRSLFRTHPPIRCLFPDTKRLFSGSFLQLLFLPGPVTLFCQQPSADSVQVVSKYSKTHTAFEAVEPFIPATAESMVLQTVNVRFNRTVPVLELNEFPGHLPLFVLSAQPAFLRHHHQWNLLFQFLTVGGPTESLIKTHRCKRILSVVLKEPPSHRQGLPVVCAFLHHLVIKHQLVLIGGDKYFMSQFHRRVQFAFVNPFSVRLEQGKDFSS